MRTIQDSPNKKVSRASSVNNTDNAGFSVLKNKFARVGLAIVLSISMATQVFVFGFNYTRAADTGFNAPTTSGNPSDWSNGNNAFSSNNQYATTDDDNDDQGYTNFNIPTIPAGSTINGIEVKLEAYSTATNTDFDEDGTFGTGNTNNDVSDWDEAGTDNTNDTESRASGSGNDSASPDTGRFAHVQGNGGYICREFNASGIGNLMLSYHWRGDSDTESGDTGLVEYRTGNGNCGNGTWTNLKTHNLQTNGTWTTQAPFSIPVSDDSFFLRFRGNASAADEGFRIDGVVLTGSPFNSTCEIQTRIAGTDSFSSYIDTTLTGNESTHTVGGPNSLWGQSWTPTDFTNANFNLEVRFNDPDSNCASSATAYLDHVQVQVHYTEPVPVVENPDLMDSCGLDIAFVIDSSGSVDSGELTQIKNAFKGFTSALAGTPTWYSVTDFDSTASLALPFTNDIVDVDAAIDATTSGGNTNWQDALTKAQGSFDPRPGKPNLVVFASDGNPNRTGNPATTVTESQAVEAAKLVANNIKTSGTRILALGVGADLDLANLQAISGPVTNTGDLTADVITTNFTDLANDLAVFANQLCGGTVTVNKYIDADGDLQTTDDQTLSVSPWNFNVGGNVVETVAGQTPAVELTPETYIVTELPTAGYSLLTAECKIGNQTVGTFMPQQSRVEGVVIAADDIVVCTFINTEDKPTKGSLKVTKTAVNGNATFNFTGSPDISPFSITTTAGTGSETIAELAPDEYTISETQLPDGWHETGNTCDDVTVVAGQTTECAIENTYRVPEPDPTVFNFIKYVCENYSQVHGNQDADNEDDTGGHFDEFANYNGGSFSPSPLVGGLVNPSEKPEGCNGQSDWSFKLSTDQAQNNDVQIVGTTNASGLLTVPFEELNANIQNALTSGDLMWVSEVEQDDYSFAAFRCYKDALNGDNLEFISFGENGLPEGNVYCIAYNIENEKVPNTSDVTICKRNEEQSPLSGWTVGLDGQILQIQISENVQLDVVSNFDYQGITGEDGCATLQDVPYGTYTLEEIMQDGWMNVSGKDDVVEVNGATETFHLVNRQDTCVEEELVVNGGFETPIVVTDQKWDIFPSGTPGLAWTVEWADSLTVDGKTRPEVATAEIQRLVNGWLPQEGQQYTELDSDWDGPGASGGSYPASVIISQNITTIPGQTYEISFYTSPRPGVTSNQVEFSWDGNLEDLIIENGALNNNTVWTKHSYSLTATTTSTEIKFEETGASNSNGMFLDNVSVKRNCVPNEEEEGDIDLGVNKIASESSVEDGANITFTITVTNNGPVNATNVVVNDQLPADFNYATHNASQGTYNEVTGIWTVGDLADEASATLTISGAVDFEVSETLVNTATIDYPGDNDSENDSSSATIGLIGKSTPSGGGGGCTVNCGGTPPPPGGGGGSTGSSTDTTPTPPGLVAGDSTTLPLVQPQILGATLPVTGASAIPALASLVIALGAAFGIRRKQ